MSLVHDPNVSIGEHMRVLKRTDGLFIIYDDRRPATDRALTDDDGKPVTWTKIEGASKYAHKLLEEEKKCPPTTQ